ncbi:hypothetical protein SAY86_017473 [Trapa natans]|uniref:YDG domain-containing protein n=1 Tax=Trapa natans TaxID=22666 RepID=A0AAN7LS47_TRANT|nr:hypothetical protein SAY86_017473 [Trapa natans]
MEPTNHGKRSAMGTKSPEKRSDHSPAAHGDIASSSTGGASSARKKVTDAIRLYRVLCKSLNEENMEVTNSSEIIKMVHIKAYKIFKEEKESVHGGMQFIGSVPGVEIGDRFYYRIEMVLVDLHRPPMAGIDYMKGPNRDVIAVSVVASSDVDDMSSPHELIYVGQGGISRSPGGESDRHCEEDQKLVGGNLALRNSIAVKNPVRVIRTVRASIRDDRDLVTHSKEVFVYDGLYVVEGCHEVRHGVNGRLKYYFTLKRLPGQPLNDHYC